MLHVKRLASSQGLCPCCRNFSEVLGVNRSQPAPGNCLLTDETGDPRPFWVQVLNTSFSIGCPRNLRAEKDHVMDIFFPLTQFSGGFSMVNAENLVALFQ